MTGELIEPHFGEGKSARASESKMNKIEIVNMDSDESSLNDDESDVELQGDSSVSEIEVVTSDNEDNSISEEYDLEMQCDLTVSESSESNSGQRAAAKQQWTEVTDLVTLANTLTELVSNQAPKSENSAFGDYVGACLDGLPSDISKIKRKQIFEILHN